MVALSYIDCSQIAVRLLSKCATVLGFAAQALGNRKRPAPRLIAQDQKAQLSA